MAKKKKNKNNKNGQTKLSKKKLLRNEYEQYKLIGDVDHSQNWLEVFTPTVVQDLFTIIGSCSDNQRKSEYIRDEMAYYGFEEVGLGTNIYTMSNPAYPGVIFKFALDDNGLADNFNDGLLQELVNEYLVSQGEKPRYTKMLARHPSAIVSVQERKVLVSSQDRIDAFRGSILRTLTLLSQKFMIIDLSPTYYHLNYGIERNGDWCFIDASDLYPLANIKDKVRCSKAVGWDDKKRKMKRCGGRLKYDKDFSHIVCDSCKAEFLPLEIRPKTKEEEGKMANSICDGISLDEREEMRQSEMQVVLTNSTRRQKSYNPQGGEEPLPTKSNPKTIFVSPKVEKEEDLEPEEATEPVKQFASFSEYLGKRESSAPVEVLGSDEGTEEDGEDDDNVVIAYAKSSVPDVGDNPVVNEDEENRIVYSVTNIDYDNDLGESMPGIIMKVDGNFDKAFDDYGLPLFIQIGDGPITQAISTSTFHRLLEHTVSDIIEEQEAYNNA